MLSPNDVIVKQTQQVPEFVFEVFDELLVLKYDKSSKTAVIKLEEVLESIECKLQTADEKYRIQYSKSTAFECGWLDIEPLYELIGWHVQFYGLTTASFSRSYYKFTAPF